MALGEADIAMPIPDMGEGEGVGEVSFSGEGFDDIHSGEEGRGLRRYLMLGRWRERCQTQSGPAAELESLKP